MMTFFDWNIEENYRLKLGNSSVRMCRFYFMQYKWDFGIRERFVWDQFGLQLNTMIKHFERVKRVAQDGLVFKFLKLWTTSSAMLKCRFSSWKKTHLFGIESHHLWIQPYIYMLPPHKWRECRTDHSHPLWSENENQCLRKWDNKCRFFFTSKHAIIEKFKVRMHANFQEDFIWSFWPRGTFSNLMIRVLL